MKMKKYILSIIVFTAALFAGLPVFAEGSKDWYPSGGSGHRAHLLGAGYSSAEAIPFPNKGAHYVYAKAGERIALASSAQGTANSNQNNAYIRMYAPNGDRVVEVRNQGQISNRTAELAGPQLPNQTGGNRYTPIYYTVPAGGEGVYRVEFTSRSNSGQGYGLAISTSWTQTTTFNNNNIHSNAAIVAWDISVVNTAGTGFIPGRVYATNLNLSTGGLPSDMTGNNYHNVKWYGKVYVRTNDGYTYRVQHKGSNGIVFAFFSNNLGFYETDDEGALISTYKSVDAQPGELAGLGKNIHNPNTADGVGHYTHKMFYNIPASDLAQTASVSVGVSGITTGAEKPTTVTTNLNIEPIVPKLTNVKFRGADGTDAQLSRKGGWIEFEANIDGNYRILISSTLESANFTPKVITGHAVAGSNRLFWDAKDGSGNNNYQGGVPLIIDMALQGAEVHFPFFDVEYNIDGIEIALLDHANLSGTPLSYQVFWDDSGITDPSTGSKVNPIVNKHTEYIASTNSFNEGKNSSSNGHNYGADSNGNGSGTWGDKKSLDTWSFILDEYDEVDTQTAIRVADLYVSKVEPNKTTLRIGDDVTYEVIVGNKNGSCPVVGAPFTFILPPGFTLDNTDIILETSSDCGSETSREIVYDSESDRYILKSTLNLSGHCDGTVDNSCEITYKITSKVGTGASSADTKATAVIMRPNDVTDIDATNTSDPKNPAQPEDEEVDLDAYYYPPTDPFFEIEHNGKDGVSNNIKDNQILNFIDDIRADNDINQTPVDVPVSGNVLTNDYSSNGILNVGSAKYYDSSGKEQNLELGDPVEIYTENGEKAGTLILKSNGEYTFSPASGFVGDVPVEYTAINGVTTESSNNTANAILTITVIPATVPGNNPPIALDDVATTKKGVTLTGDILANDSDPDGNSLTVTGATQGSTTITVGTPTVVSGQDADGNDVENAGSITINANGKIEFVPNGSFVGTIDPIEYTISDGKGGTDKANLYITVIEDHGNTTFANDDANTAKKGVTMTGNVLDNDFDPEGNDQTLTKIKIGDNEYTPDGKAIVIPDKGKLTINSNGKYTFEPEEDFVGTLVVEQTVCDNGTPVACDNATLYLTSLPESDNSTTAVDDFYETGNNTPITGNVMENDYDNEGDTQKVTTTETITTKEGGTVIIDEDGNFTYTPPADKNGIFDTFEYKVCDNGTPEACDVAEVIIAVGVCYEEVGGKSFYWNYSSGSGVATETITQPVANYGFTFDIYELDNSFNMKINGVQLAVDEIEFQSNGTSGINIMFADGDKYEVDTQGAEGKAIWQMRGNAANPLIRVVISHTGKVTMYGSKVSYGPLFPLKFIEEKGNEFNPIDFSNAGGENNVIEVTQNRVGVTIMDGKGYGRNMVDCPNYWYGYDDNDWAENSNWTDNYVPKAYEDIVFATEDNNRGIIQGMSGPGAGKGAADKDLYLDGENHNYKDTNEPSGGRIIKDLINDSDVDLVITTTNQLIIDGEVKDNNLDAGTIVVKSAESEATGTLLFSNPSKNESVNATVEFYNKAFTCPDCGFYRKQWQYFGIPVDKSKFPYLSPQVETINEWMENVDGNKWVNRAANHELDAFRGYEINNSNTTKPTHIYDFSGILNVGNAVVALTKTSNVNYSGMNLIANSFTAAIPISEDAITGASDALVTDNELAEKAVYLFNTGTRDQWRKLNGGSIAGIAGGQYTAVPVKLGGQTGLPDRILSMHSFMVNAGSNTNITLKYDQLVKNETNGTNQPAWRSVDSNAKRELPYIILDVIGEGSADRVWLFEESSTTRGYDNGWDGHKMLEGDLIQVFATDDDHNKYQVTTVPQLDNTTLGIAARENESYTISVAVADDVEVRRLYLHDLFTGRGYLLKNGAEFVISGTRSANQNRFKITSSPIAEAQKGDDAPIINTYVRDNVIVVENRSGENAIVSVYDISGRFVGKAQIAKDEIKSFAELSVGTGVKVVKVVSDSGSINRSNRVLLK